MTNVLIITGDKQIFQAIASCFTGQDKVTRCTEKKTALEKLNGNRFDYIFIDLGLLLDSQSGKEYKLALQPFWRIYPAVEIIVMSSPEGIREAVQAVKAGASNYLTYPIMPEEVKYVVESINESQIVLSELNYLRDQFRQSDSENLLKTKSPTMKHVFDRISSVAPTMSTVLLTGETGTGKGVMARAIHSFSKCKNARFISAHCGAIPDTLIESELFGHEKGAFTGATRRKLGKFEIARDGTIFLDEIATISFSAQIKLLQVLQDRIFQRLGGEQAIETNTRVIAATNMDLLDLCDAGQFRRDLYYRLNVFPIEIPALRERTEDIPLLVEYFLERLNRFNAKEIHSVHPEVLSAFAEYPWPGNIREMENLIERAYIIEDSSVLTPASFPAEMFAQKRIEKSLLINPSRSLAEMRRSGLEALEKTYLVELLQNNRGKVKAAAEVAKVTPRQLHNLMKKYDLHKEEFKN